MCLESSGFEYVHGRLSVPSMYFRVVCVNLELDAGKYEGSVAACHVLFTFHISQRYWYCRPMIGMFDSSCHRCLLRRVVSTPSFSRGGRVDVTH